MKMYLDESCICIVVVIRICIRYQYSSNASGYVSQKYSQYEINFFVFILGVSDTSSDKDTFPQFYEINVNFFHNIREKLLGIMTMIDF